jgi:hypothetical protein
MLTERLSLQLLSARDVDMFENKNKMVKNLIQADTFKVFPL